MSYQRDNFIILADGRRLGYAEYGYLKGWPVMFFHGTPGSWIMARFVGPKAGELGVRLIAPERPGYGLSDLQLQRRLVDWPEDVAELSDFLNLERFAVVGVSGGGPYAIVCAWKLAGRIVAAGVISSLALVDRVKRELNYSYQLTALAVRRTWFINLALGFLDLCARRYPEILIKGMGLAAPWEDKKILSQPEIQITQIDSVMEAFRGGPRGTALELKLYDQPWGFEVEEIKIPVHLWHGEADLIVSVQMGRYLADHIPTCQARFIPRAGHLWIFEGYEEVFRVLKKD